MTATIGERVVAGAAFLDTAEPGWWKHIDVERLDLASPCRCVLGQLEADRWDPEEHAEPFDSAIDRFGEPDVIGLGFDAWRRSGPMYYTETDQLTIAWRELIEARRGGAA